MIVYRSWYSHDDAGWICTIRDSRLQGVDIRGLGETYEDALTEAMAAHQLAHEEER